MVCCESSFSSQDAQPALVLRRAELCDEGDPLFTLIERAHAESRFAYAPFSRRKARRVLAQALAEGRRHLLVVADYRGLPQGFVYASSLSRRYSIPVLWNREGVPYQKLIEKCQRTGNPGARKVPRNHKSGRIP